MEELCRDIKFTGYLPKPIDKQKLEKLIESLD